MQSKHGTITEACAMAESAKPMHVSRPIISQGLLSKQCCPTVLESCAFHTLGLVLPADQTDGSADWPGLVQFHLMRCGHAVNAVAVGTIPQLCKSSGSFLVGMMLQLVTAASLPIAAAGSLYYAATAGLHLLVNPSQQLRGCPAEMQTPCFPNMHIWCAGLRAV